MTLRWKVFATQVEAGRFAAAVDQRLGYPRTHTRSEYTRGAGRHALTPPHTETHCAIIRLRTGEYAVQVDATVEALDKADVNLDIGSGIESVRIDIADATEVDRIDAIAVAPRGGLTLRRKTEGERR